MPERNKKSREGKNLPVEIMISSESERTVCDGEKEGKREEATLICERKERKERFLFPASGHQKSGDMRITRRVLSTGRSMEKVTVL